MKEKIKRKILFIHPYFGNGGAEKGLKMLSKFLSDEGYLIHLFCLEISEQNLKRNSKDIFFLKSNSERIISSSIDFLKIIKKGNYDIVIPTQSPSISLYSPIVYLFNLFFLKKKIKIISFERLSPWAFYKKGKFEFLKKLLYKLGLKLSDCLMTNSLEQQIYYKYKFPKKLSFYIPNSYSTNHIKKISSIKKSSSKDNIFKILWVGRLEDIKDPFLAINSMKYLDNRFSLHIFGTGSLKEKIEENIYKLKFEKKIIVYSNIEKLNYGEYDLFLHTSFYEGLPNTFLESLSNNIPIVSTYFITGLSELYFPFWTYPCSRSSEDIAKNILNALSQNDKKVRKDNSINKLIKKFYNDENMFQNFQTALEKM